MKKTLTGAMGAVLVLLTAFSAPPASAASVGNFNLIIPDRFDFHTWIWAISGCPNGVVPECLTVSGIPQPVAGAYPYLNAAHLVDGHYSLVIDDPFGLRCGNVYYGSISPTHDVYVWDAATLAGTLTSSFDVGCDGGPGTLTYPFSLVRM